MEAKLYELTHGMGIIAANLDAWECQLEEAGGEIEDVNFDEYIGLKELAKGQAEKINEKILNICKVAENKRVEQARVKGEINRINEIVAGLNAEVVRKQRAIDGLERYLLNQMNTIGLDSVTDGVNKVKITESVRTVIVDALRIPERFMIEKVTRSPDKKEIKAYLKAGNSIAGAELQVAQRVKFS